MPLGHHREFRATHFFNLVTKQNQSFVDGLDRDTALIFGDDNTGDDTAIFRDRDRNVEVLRNRRTWIKDIFEQVVQVVALRTGEIGADLAAGAVPLTESLKTTLDRVEPFWNSDIAPRLAAGDSLLIAAHGNSLRALVKILMNVPDADIVGVEIPTGNPLVFDLAPGGTTPTAVRYLDAARAATLPPLP